MSLERLPPRASAVEACAERIATGIVSGQLQPGQRLPAERVLAEQLGVSRMTLRAGLTRVAAEGLLAVRQGSGYVVRDFLREGGPSLLSSLIAVVGGPRRIAVARDVLAVRRALARLVLERLAVRVDAGMLQRLTAVVDAYAARAVEGAPSTAVSEGDVAVVAAVLAEVGSPVFNLCLNPMLAVVRRFDALRDTMYVDPPSHVAMWRSLLAHLENGALPPAELAQRMVGALEKRDEATLERFARADTRSPGGSGTRRFRD